MHRVNLYGGLFSVDIFRTRFRLSRALYSIVIAGTFSINLVLTLVEAGYPQIGLSNALAQTILAEISALLVCFIIVGSILIRRLKAYFKENYNKQRSYLLGALLLIIASLCVMCVRYSLEYTYRNHRAKRPETQTQLWISLTAFAI